MREFLLSQMDYISFVYGLALVLLSSVCLFLWNRHKAQLPWHWLGLFGLFHGVNEWLDVFAPSLGDSVFFQWVRLSLLAVSLVCLFEFGRSSCGRLKFIRIGGWIYIPLFLIVAETSGGTADVNAAVRYSFGFFGAALAAIALWRASRENRSDAFPLLAATVAMAGFALTAGLVPDTAGVFMSGIVNHDLFLKLTGFPVELLRACSAAGVGLALWYYHEGSIGATPHPQTTRYLNASMFRAMLVLALALTAGWFCVVGQGQREATIQRGQLLSYAQQAVTTLEPALIRGLTASPSDVDSLAYQTLKSRLQHLRAVMTSVRFVYLMRLVDGKIVFLADSEAQGSKDESPPGQVYDEASAKLKEVFVTAKGVVDDPTTDRWGSWLSAYVPYTDSRTGELIAILGLDQSARDYNLAVALGRCKGIIFVGIICCGILFALTYWRRFVVFVDHNHDGRPMDP